MPETIQARLFKQIEAQLGNHQSLVDEIGELLGVSRDSAYRRLRGSTELSMSETEKLCQHYGISFDRLANLSSNSVSFYRNSMGDGDAQSVIRSGFTQLFESLKVLDSANVSEILYFTMEIPVFQIIQVPELLAFKLFYWTRIDSGQVHDKEKFQIGQWVNSEEDRKVIQEIASLYIRIPSTEIVFHTALTFTASQIMFFLESGKFQNPAEAILLFDQLHALIEHLKIQAKLGRKFRFGAPAPEQGPLSNYRLFHNEMIPSQNTAFTQADGQISTYLEYNALSFMRTDDPGFCEMTRNTLEKIMEKSTLISTVSEKERNKYFNRLEKEIAQMRSKALHYI